MLCTALNSCCACGDLTLWGPTLRTKRLLNLCGPRYCFSRKLRGGLSCIESMHIEYWTARACSYSVYSCDQSPRAPRLHLTCADARCAFLVCVRAGLGFKKKHAWCEPEILCSDIGIAVSIRFPGCQHRSDAECSDDNKSCQDCCVELGDRCNAARVEVTALYSIRRACQWHCVNGWR